MPFFHPCWPVNRAPGSKSTPLQLWSGSQKNHFFTYTVWRMGPSRTTEAFLLGYTILDRGLTSKNPESGLGGSGVVSLRSKAISEVEAATPITCESFRRGDLQKERAVSSQYPRIIKYASLASSYG